ncbi:MAG TPA: prenyltransferase [Thermoanaerobaculia bacterium]
MRLSLTHSPLPIAEHGHRSILRGLWRLADPKIALASLVPFCVGAALAWRETERIDVRLAAAAFLALFLVEVGKNAVNDLYDFRSGADAAVRPEERSPFSGGKRVLIDGLLTERDLAAIAWIAFVAAGVIGVAIALERQPLLLLLGAAAALVSVLYSMPPVHLSYRGLGELAVFAVYGPGIVLGSLLLFGGRITAESVDVSMILGILIALVLLTNELPDERADRVAGKRTLVVRMGRELATSFIGFLFAVAFAIALALVALGGAGTFAGALAGLPVAWIAVLLLRRDLDRPPVAGQTATLITYVVTGVGLALGALLL